MNNCPNCGRHLPVLDVHGDPLNEAQCPHCGLVSPHTKQGTALVVILLLVGAVAVFFWLRS